MVEISDNSILYLEFYLLIKSIKYVNISKIFASNKKLSDKYSLY